MERCFGSRKWQARWVKVMSRAETFEELEQRIQEFTDELSPEAPPAPWRPQWRRCPPPVGSAAAARRIRRLYYRDKARALREICEGPSPSCEIPLEDLRHHFQKAFERKDGGSAELHPRDLSPLPKAEPHLGLQELLQEFTPEEVKERVSKVRTKKGRKERISPQRLRQADPGGHILAAIFNGCRRFGLIPSAWKKSTTILHYKKGDPDDPRNWRPLFLCNSLYKMYARCLARRISQWARQGQVISPQQKACTSSCEGQLQHAFLLQSVLDIAWHQRTECAVATLDLANAFGSLSQRYIFQTLSELGMPPNFVTLIRGLYRGCTTVVRTPNGETEEIPFQRGLRQGCPLSPFIFNLAMEPLIRYIASGPGGFPLDREVVNVLAFVDDLVLIAKNDIMLQKMLDRASAAANWMGLSFKPSKCTTLHIYNRRLHPSTFTVQGRGIAPLRRGGTFTYLGTPMCAPNESPQALKASFKKLMGEAEEIDHSPLNPTQKIDALRTYLFPKISSHLKNVHVARKDLHEASHAIADMMWTWRDPPDDFPVEPWAAFHILSWYIGKGILELQSLADVAAIAHAFRLLTSPDRTVANVAFLGLHSSAWKWLSGRPLSKRDLAAYLNGSSEYGEGSLADLWSRARNATRRLKDLVRWKCHCDEWTLEIRQGSGQVRVFSREERRLEAALKDALQGMGMYRICH